MPSPIYLPFAITASLQNPRTLEDNCIIFNELVLASRDRAGRLHLASKMMPDQSIHDRILFMDAKHPFRDIGTWHDIKVAVNPAFLDPFFKVFKDYTGLDSMKLCKDAKFRFPVLAPLFSNHTIYENLMFENGTLTSRQFVRSSGDSECVVKSAIKELHEDLGSRVFEPEFKMLDNGHMVRNPAYPKSYDPIPGFSCGFEKPIQQSFWNALWDYCEPRFLTHVQRQYLAQARILGEFRWTKNLPHFRNGGGYGVFSIAAPEGHPNTFKYDGVSKFALNVKWEDFRNGNIELMPWMQPEIKFQPELPDQPDQTDANPDLANPEE